MRYVIVKLAENYFGIPVDEAREILKLPEVTPLPQSPLFIEGVINLRGHHVAVMDLRKRLGYPSLGPDKERFVVMLKCGRQVLGLILDKALDIFEIDDREVDEAAKVGTGYLDPGIVRGLCRKEKLEIFLLNPAALLDDRKQKAA